MRVKVVLSDADNDEVVLGPFNNGVCLESSQVGQTHMMTMRDVVTRETIIRCFGSFWAHGERWFKQAFVQSMNEDEEI